MKRIWLIVGILFVLAGVLPGCGSSPDAAAPTLKANDRIYCLDGTAKPFSDLPEGYALAGTLEMVKYSPRENMTGRVADGSELYTSPEKPETVYIRIPDGEGYIRFICLPD